jgi:uncharacterized protein (DUF488 family)
MLGRQRVLLALLHAAGGQASHFELTKWAFLLRHDSDSRGGSSFYDFVPYRYGPYSFSLVQEAGLMVRNALMEEVDCHHWRLLPAGRAQLRTLPRPVGADAEAIVRAYRADGSAALARQVYQRFPWYSMHSVKDPRAERPQSSPAIFTVGYEGLSVEALLNGLLREGIECVVDVRNNPVSRRFGFHKSTLARLCASLGFDYEHLPELGIEPEARSGLHSEDDYRALFEDYERRRLPAVTNIISRAVLRIEEKASVLMCMERKATACHRSRLARRVSTQLPLPVRHLEIDP